MSKTFEDCCACSKPATEFIYNGKKTEWFCRACFKVELRIRKLLGEKKK